MNPLVIEIERLSKELGTPESRTCLLLGISPSYLTNWRKGTEPRDKTYYKIVKNISAIREARRPRTIFERFQLFFS